MITGVLGTVPIGTYYFVSVYDPSLFRWYDFAIAVIRMSLHRTSFYSS